MVGSSGFGFGTTFGGGSEGLRLSGSAAYIRGIPSLQLPLLTLGSLGTQIVWSVEMAYGTPYLLELGLSKAAMAAVYTAGPIAGLVVQPAIGLLADRSTHPWGRRRPFLVASCLGCSVFVLLFGYARVLANLFHLPDAVLPLTVMAIWGLDFSVNAVMALNRALLFDVLPAEQQADGNAWLARLCSIGSILGFFVGDLDLPATFPFSWLPSIGDDPSALAPSEAQLRCLSLLTVAFILITNALVVWAVVEQRLEPVPGYRTGSSITSRPEKQNPLRVIISTAGHFLQTARTLSPPIRDVLRIQTFSWICWFPLMFYSTEWISSVAVAGYLEDLRKSGQPFPSDMKKLKAKGTRAGSHAMFLQALVSFGFSLVLPLLLPSPGGGDERRRPSFASSLTSSLPLAASTIASDTRRASLPILWLRYHFGGVRLTTLWTIAHFAMTLITWMTWPVAASKSVGMATLLIAMAGYSWSVTVWGPYSLLGIFIQSGLAGQEQGSAAGAYQSVPMSESWSFNSTTGPGEAAVADESINQASLSTQPRRASDVNRDRSVSSVNGMGSRSGHIAETEDEAEEALLCFDPTLSSASPLATAATASHGASDVSHQAGTILGIHNTAIVIPQLLVSLLASLIFAIYDSDRSSDSSSGAGSVTVLPKQQQGDALGVVFRIGGFASIAAGVYTIKLGRQWGDVIAGATGGDGGDSGAADGGSQRCRSSH